MAARATLVPATAALWIAAGGASAPAEIPPPRAIRAVPGVAAQATPSAAQAAARARGQGTYLASCASCHGSDVRGIGDRGPSLRGVGAAAIDFYLATGRMPLAQPGIEPPRTEPALDARARADVREYLTALDAGGPSIPAVQPARGDVALGRSLFADSCSGCHQIAAQGGVDPQVTAPALQDATPVQIGEAIRVGPYLMPRFGPRSLDKHDVDSIARYVTTYGRHPLDRGGWGIGNVGPIPEGLVAWLLGGGALLLIARLIGERAR
jgi:ubiquinol-cytochrome c reductase cytochrome c subunit